jgi:hypothetical protein
MSWLSHALGTDYKAPAQSQPLNQFLASLQNPNFGQDQLAETTRATVADALPDFLKNMEGTKEDNIRRGISTGDLGTSFEGDLTSAFQRNISNSVASQAAGMFGQRNNLLYQGYNDQLDREQAAQNDAAQRKSGLSQRHHRRGREGRRRILREVADGGLLAMPVYQNSGPGLGQAILGGVNDFVDARQKRVQDELLKQQIQDMARNRVRQSAVDAQNGLHFTEPGEPLPSTVAQNIGDYAGRAGAASIPDNAVNSDISFSPNGGAPTLSRAGAGRSLIPGAPQSAPQRQTGTNAAPSFQNILSSMMGGQAPDRGAQYEFGKGYYVDHGPAWEAADVARAQKAQDQFTPMLVQRMVAQQDKADKIARYTAAGVPADRAALYVDNPALADNDPRIGKPHTDVMAERTAKSVMLNGRPAEVMIDKAGNAFDAMGNKVTGALTPYVAPPNPETAALRELALGQRKDSMSQRNEARLVQQYTEATKKYSQTADALQAINENREGALKGDPIAQQTLLTGLHQAQPAGPASHRRRARSLHAPDGIGREG